MKLTLYKSNKLTLYVTIFHVIRVNDFEILIIYARHERGEIVIDDNCQTV